MKVISSSDEDVDTLVKVVGNFDEIRQTYLALSEQIAGKRLLGETHFMRKFAHRHVADEQFQIIREIFYIQFFHI